MIEEFFRQVAVLLFANVLTVIFFYSLWAYTKREKMGIEKEPGSGGYLSGMLMVVGFLMLGMVFWGFFDGWPVLSGLAAGE